MTANGKQNGQALPQDAPQDAYRWAAVLRRDASADGQFVYAVSTTGIFCRPSCAARAPKPEHVTFFENAAEATRAGFRPCKRCNPAGPSLAERNTETIRRICHVIEQADGIPSLEELAKHAKMSAYHLHRMFKAVTGVTPRAYAAAHRASRLRSELAHGNSVTEAIYNAGYNSSGRFYEEANSVLGMKPKDYLTGGSNAKIHFAIGQCSLGSILVASSERGVCAIFIGDDPELLLQDLQNRFPKATLLRGDAGYEATVAKVVSLVENPGTGFDLPLDLKGTLFQQRVWQALRNIPVGTTISYTELAKRVGNPKSVRAVAQACGANPVAIAIPCHRVVRNDGALSGYRWGVERKRALLEKEKTRGGNEER
jgi:AraC family transcriptional regulator of adaptative response/methylated-DNA-[protein]-cysteine methyltransferase